MPRLDYLYGNDRIGTLERLQGLEQIEDPASIACLEKLGDLSSWQCLEVGAGAGSIAHWLSQRVGPMGRVDATDTDPRFLEPLAGQTLEVWRHDVARDALPPEDFDLIHVRHVLIHLGGGVAAALDNLCTALKPGGVLVIEESDFTGATAVEPTPAPLQGLYNVGLAAVLNLYRQRGMDVCMGASLAEMLRQRSLTVHDSTARCRKVQGNSAEALFHGQSYAQVRDEIVNVGLAAAALMDDLIAAHNDDQLFYQTRQTFAVTAKKNS